jgi:hypothetical protein
VASATIEERGAGEGAAGSLVDIGLPRAARHLRPAGDRIATRAANVRWPRSQGVAIIGIQAGPRPAKGSAMKRIKSKLNLGRETVRSLDILRAAHGGQNHDHTLYNCPSLDGNGCFSHVATCGHATACQTHWIQC